MTPNTNQPIFSDYTLEQLQTGAASRRFIARVFLWMAGALLLSAACAFLFATTPSLLSLLITTTGLSLLGKIVFFAPLGFVLLMSFGYHRLSVPLLTALFLLYAAVTGISLSFILLVYTEGSVLSCFVAAAAMFGIMAFMGYTTDKDLTSFGRILLMGLLGIVIASVINFFMHSSGLEWIISIVGVAVFTGLTAYDVQKLKAIGAGLGLQGENGEAVAVPARKAAIYGALTLYLDFINIFLMLLRLFGRKR